MTDCVYVLLALCGTYSVSPDTVNIFLCQICFKPNQLRGAGVLFCTLCFLAIKPDLAWPPIRPSKSSFAKWVSVWIASRN